MYHTSTNLNSSRSITTVFYWRTMTTFIFEGAQPSTSDSWIMKSPEIFSLMVIVLGPSFMQIIIVVFSSVAIPCEVKESHWLNNCKSILPISWSMSSSFSMPSWLSMSSRYHYNRENLQLPCLLFHIRGTPSRDILAKPLSLKKVISDFTKRRKVLVWRHLHWLWFSASIQESRLPLFGVLAPFTGHQLEQWASLWL